MAHGFATEQSLNLSERRPISSNHYENNYRWQQILNGRYIKISFNRVSMIFGVVSPVIEQCLSSQLCVSNILGAFIGKMDSHTVTAPFQE